MIGGRVLCHPISEGVTEDGMRVIKSDSGIITQINVGHDLKKAVIASVGTPMLDRPVLNVNVGDEVWYNKDSDFENEINGVTYFVMTQEDLLMCKTPKK